MTSSNTKAIDPEAVAERAAICEYDGEMSREEAELFAMRCADECEGYEVIE